MIDNQNGTVQRGYRFVTKITLTDFNNAPVVSSNLIWWCAPSMKDATMTLTKTSGNGITPTDVPGTYLLSLEAADTILLTKQSYYHEVSDTDKNLYLRGRIVVQDTLVV